MSAEKPDAAWTQDCQGKQDYDAELVSLSSRYYPRGGGFHTFDTLRREWRGNDSRPEIPPHAVTSIMIGEEVIAEAKFDAETEEAVKTLVEAWAAEQCAIVREAVRSALQQNRGG